MKKYVLAVLLTLMGALAPISPVLADAPPALAGPYGLALIEIKITGNEYVMLENNSAYTIADLSRYWLYNFNDYNPLVASVSGSSQQLPAAPLGAGQTVLLSSTGGITCGAAITAKLAISLTDSKGFLEVVQTSLAGGSLQQAAGDAVSWSNASGTGAVITSVPTGSSDVNGTHVYYRYQSVVSPPAYAWKLADTDINNVCQLVVSGTVASGSSNPGNQLLPGSPPPATIISLSDGSQIAGLSALPPADIGLAAPIINEMLPNPAEPQTDSEDEFIELYNSNDVAFDLTGFKLQTGTTTLHSYIFPAGSSLDPKSFRAFYSIDTGLSLSNTGGQARLLGPLGNIISQADAYGTAPDGQSWALANGKWYFTTTPTPGSANVINQPLSIKALSVGTTAKKSATTASKTTTPKVKAASTSPSNGSSSGAAKNASPLHPLVLAGVGIGAVAYAAYEYRNDLRNRFYQLRRYQAARRTAGK